ncbi:MAG: FKBP-type peptidyl-prolyl cis-trans isomerase [Bacteroidales bacterium]|nr:FKBP-type peptidyl-prolyl cis-trans isomerase [Bacteroidales bacterium]
MKIGKLLSGSLLIIAVIILSSCGQQTGTKKDVAMNTELDSVSYAIGIDIATNLQKSGFDNINVDALAKGFSDIFDEVEGAMDPKDANTYVMTYFNKERERKASENLRQANEFLEENKTKEGVITTESGLQYKIITEGSGPIPGETDQVKVYYKGTLIDGREFDATTPDTPAQFRVNGVIKGWVEALQIMPVGSKWELYVHPDLAYGANPRQGGIIEANHALIFEIELLEIVK